MRSPCTSSKSSSRSPQLEKSPHAATKTQRSQKQINKLKKKNRDSKYFQRQSTHLFQTQRQAGHLWDIWGPVWSDSALHAGGPDIGLGQHAFWDKSAPHSGASSGVGGTSGHRILFSQRNSAIHGGSGPLGSGQTSGALKLLASTQESWGKIVHAKYLIPRKIESGRAQSARHNLWCVVSAPVTEQRERTPLGSLATPKKGQPFTQKMDD